MISANVSLILRHSLCCFRCRVQTGIWWMRLERWLRWLTVSICPVTSQTELTDYSNRYMIVRHWEAGLVMTPSPRPVCIYPVVRKAYPEHSKVCRCSWISALEIVIELPKGRVVQNVFCRERWLAVLNSFYSLKLSRLCSPIVLVPGKEKCIYHTCWQFLEICAVSRVSKKEIGRTFKKIIRTQETSLELITTGDFMVRQVINYPSVRCSFDDQ